jgi:hypothetical protein
MELIQEYTKVTPAPKFYVPWSNSCPDQLVMLLILIQAFCTIIYDNRTPPTLKGQEIRKQERYCQGK